MSRSTITSLILLTAVMVALGGHAFAEGKGQEDLDQATLKKVEARSLQDLLDVATLCERALAKGLDDESAAFARQLCSGALYEHASRMSSAIFDRESPDPRWPLIRQMAVKSLERALKHVEKLGEAQYLIARLEALPGGNRERGIKAASAAVRLAGGDKQQLSKALVLRATLNDEADGQLADLNQAVLIDPTNVEAWRTRGTFYLSRGDHAKAAADFTKVLSVDDANVNAYHALAEALTNQEKYDEALKYVEKAVELDPQNALGYTLRARLHVLKQDAPAAFADLDKALELNDRELTALMMRARLNFIEDNLEKSKADIARALEIRPGLVQGIVQRSMIAAAEGRYDQAITDMRNLLRTSPKNTGWRLQLAGYYLASDRPRRAIDIYDDLLSEDPQSWMSLRGRGDALLAVGKQAEAIKDYEQVLKIEPKHTGTLNNLAWVLATSPEDTLRNAKRSIELATKACELTEYKAAHILSTLASGYAESGDFETAIKWSTKAVELGQGESVVDQLKKELESYKQKKPWRELQETEEKPDFTEPSGGKFRL